MLFKQIHLNGIKSGKITLAFRRWKKLSVKSGTLLHTSIGIIKIGAIEPIKEIDITEKDAMNAGFENKVQLLESLSDLDNGIIYKIKVGYHYEDPRIKSREQTDISQQEFDFIIEKLNSLDKYSRKGEWTIKVLLTIKDNPNLNAIGIAKLTGFEKEWLKLNIRKLKNLGLTISHTVGYELSPKGKVYIEKLGQKL